MHGLSTPASMYNSVARHMANNGCRVLLYGTAQIVNVCFGGCLSTDRILLALTRVFSLDLYSRGYSEGPSVKHEPQLYVTQLHELLDHVGWKKCNLVGLSLVSGGLDLLPSHCSIARADRLTVSSCRRAEASLHVTLINTLKL